MARFSLSVGKLAGLAALAAILVSTTADAQKTLTMATPETCKFPFKYKEAWWFTCTNLDSTAPWCILKEEYKPKDQGNDWLNCDPKAFKPLTAYVNGETGHQCVERLVNGTSLFGCSAATSSGPGTCMIADGRTAFCDKISEGINDGVQHSNIQAGNPNQPEESEANAAESTSGASTSVIAAGVGCVGAVALLAGLFVYRRRQSSQNMAWQYQEKSIESMAIGGGQSVASPGLVGGVAPGCRESTASSQMYLPSSPGERIYPVVSTYTPTLSDELEIQPGDKVSILIEYDDGWCQGINHTRGGTKGVFPKHCIDMSANVTPGDTRPGSMADGPATTLQL